MTSAAPPSVDAAEKADKTETATTSGTSGSDTLRSKIGGLRDHRIDIAIFRNDTVAVKRFRHLNPEMKDRKSRNYIKLVFCI